MSYLKQIKPYQSVDLSNHLPFFIGNERVGWIQKTFAEHLKQFEDVFSCNQERIQLSDDLNNFDNRSAAVKNALTALADQGVVKHNPYTTENAIHSFQKVDILPVGSDPFDAPLMGIERYYANMFGIMRYNVSIVGYTSDGVWVAQRSDKVESPNKLDHMVSGCCTTEYDITATLEDEAIDEAGFDKNLIKQTKPMTSYYVSRSDKNGDLFHELVSLFEIELPNDYTPKTNQPDEIRGFRLVSIDDLKNEILNRRNLLQFSKVIFIHFLIKHKHITEKHKEYDDLIAAFNYNPADDMPAY